MAVFQSGLYHHSSGTSGMTSAPRVHILRLRQIPLPPPVAGNEMFALPSTQISCPLFKGMKNPFSGPRSSTARKITVSGCSRCTCSPCSFGVFQLLPFLSLRRNTQRPQIRSFGEVKSAERWTAPTTRSRFAGFCRAISIDFALGEPTNLDPCEC